MTPIKVLPNNNTPATHFKLLYNTYIGNCNARVYTIDLIDRIVSVNIVAILKIHPKQNN